MKVTLEAVVGFVSRSQSQALTKVSAPARVIQPRRTLEVTANDSKDAANTQAIRSHLKQIVTMFANGDFSTPMFIHSQTPPGVPVMKQKRATISYTFEELPAGGRIRIQTADPEALKAVHEFLRFQIEDHHTGDSQDIA